MQKFAAFATHITVLYNKPEGKAEIRGHTHHRKLNTFQEDGWRLKLKSVKSLKTTNTSPVRCDHVVSCLEFASQLNNSSVHSELVRETAFGEQDIIIPKL